MRARRSPGARPAVRGDDDGGARDLNSTYLHLVVCDLEFQAMTMLVGEARARAVLEGNTHYSWIYEQVLANSVVREVYVRHGAVVPRRPGSGEARERLLASASR